MTHNSIAVVISKKRAGEQDIQLTLFSKELGKIYCKAKGASKITSSRLSSLQLGNTVSISLSKNEPYYVQQAKTLYSFMQSQKSLTQTNLLFFLLEFFNKITPIQEANPKLYELLSKAIISIEESKVGIFIKCEIEIINQLGYGTPDSIRQSLLQQDFRQSQKQIQRYIESIIDKPIESTKLFS